MDPIVSKNTRIRHPDAFSIQPFSIVDDFCYFSTQVRIGKCCHIANGCSVAGGKDRIFTLGDYCSISAGVKIWCTSDDFVNDLVIIVPPEAGEIKNHLLSADVTIGNYCAVGSNSVIMPGNHLPEGTSIGAMTFVPANFQFEPWSVYAGVPARRVKARNKENVLAQVRLLEARMGGQPV